MDNILNRVKSYYNKEKDWVRLMDAKERIKQVAEIMESIIEDTTVPRNIRNKINESKVKILAKEGEVNVNLSSAIYLIDEISNDINMPFHTRTELWSILSELESIKEELK